VYSSLGTINRGNKRLIVAARQIFNRCTELAASVGQSHSNNILAGKVLCKQEELAFSGVFSL
jgi:hypothetical protein